MIMQGGAKETALDKVEVAFFGGFSAFFGIEIVGVVDVNKHRQGGATDRGVHAFWTVSGSLW